MNIYLIGYMASGKTTVGKKLSRALSYEFIDLDLKIEEDNKLCINRIFSEKGESFFRELEREALKGTFQHDNLVVSLGGGTPCFFDNLEQINVHGQSVYIKLSAKSLASRLDKSKTIRPLIQGVAENELFEFVQQQLGEREVYYNRAHFIIKGENLQLKELIQILDKSE